MSVYYDPEEYGLTVVGTAEVPLGYEFDMFVIWRDRHGKYLWASDSGCSCPVPFDGRNLSNLPVGTLDDALNDLAAWSTEHDADDPERRTAAKDLTDRLRPLVTE